MPSTIFTSVFSNIQVPTSCRRGAWSRQMGVDYLHEGVDVVLHCLGMDILYALVDGKDVPPSGGPRVVDVFVVDLPRQLHVARVHVFMQAMRHVRKRLLP